MASLARTPFCSRLWRVSGNFHSPTQSEHGVYSVKMSTGIFGHLYYPLVYEGTKMNITSRLL